MEVYLDIIFVENVIMNSIIIYATSIFSKAKPKTIRIILASAIGAIYVIVAYITKAKIYSNIFIKILLSVLIVYVAFNPQKVQNLWKYFIIFQLTTCLFGGVAYSMIYLIKPQNIFIQNGMFVGDYAMKTIFLGAVIGVILVILSVKIIKSKIFPKDMIYEIQIKIFGEQIKLQAMIDTGNLLKEPFTGIPVIVVEKNALYEIIPMELLENLEEILMGNMEKISEETRQKYAPRLKVIPFSSLGKQNGMLVGVKADEVIIEGEYPKKIEPSIIGIYDKSLTKRGEYKALLGLELVK